MNSYSKNYKSCLVLVLVFFSLSLYSQYSINGKILAKSTNEVLSFANINYNNKQTVSDNTGYFNFKIKDNHLTLKISYVGFNSYSLDTIFKSKENNLGNIYLSENSRSLGEVTITSGKYRKLIKDATISIESIKPKFLENNNTVSFDDILEKIPGVNYVDGQANIRGGSGFSYGAGSRVLVLINNLPALQFDSGYPNWENIPTELVEKVEVMKGAGSALYGSAAMNGVINILPIYAKKKLLVKVKKFFTVYDNANDKEKQWWDTPPIKHGASIVIAKKIKSLDVVGSIYAQRFKSYKELCYNNYIRGTLNLNYHINKSLSIGVNTNFNKGKKLNFFYWKNATSGAYRADSTAYAGQNKRIHIIDPFLTYYSKRGAIHKLLTRVYLASNLVSGDKSNRSKSYYGEYQYQKQFAQYDFTITGGLTATLSNTTAELYGDTSYVAKNIGTYLQVEKRFFNRLSLVAGGRYENNTIKGPKIIRGKDISAKYISESKPVFRFGMNFKAFKYTNFRASWGQGFRYPTVAEKFTNTFSGSLIILPNPDLRSESGTTIELGLRQGWKLFKITGFADISVFQSKYKDMIEFHLKRDKKGFFFFSADNIGNTIIKGIEFSTGFKGKIKNINLGFLGGYLKIDPKYIDFTDEIRGGSSVDYNILKYRYKESFKFDLQLDYKGLNLGFGSSYNSFMEAVDKAFEINGLVLKGVKKYRQEHNKGNNIYRLRFGYSSRYFSIMFNIDNLFNKEYSVRPGLLEAPRSFTLTTICKY